MAYSPPTTSAPYAAIFALVTIGGFGTGPVYAGSCCEQGASPTAAEQPSCHTSAQRTTRDTPPFHAPHGGQLSKAIWNYYEVVYGPQETRVYLYDMFRDPVTARGIQGQATMRVHSSGESFEYPLYYVPVQSGQDYLALGVDLSHVRDRDMDVEFNLSNLPHESEPTARFTQVYAASDSQYGADTAVGAMPVAAGQRRAYDSTPMIADAPCHSEGASPRGCSCQGCGGGSANGAALPPVTATQPTAIPGTQSVGALRRLPAAAEGGSVSRDASSVAPGPSVVIVPMTPADDTVIRAQRVCPVTNNPLGSHGPPTKLLVNGQSLFVCCRGCVGKVEQNPDMYLARVSH